MKNETIGFIGTGYMGSRFVLKLLDEGYTVHVYDRTKEKAEPLAKKGAILEESLANLASQSTIIMSSLFNDKAVEDVYLGKDGVLQHVKPGIIIIELSSIKPETVQRIYNKAKEKGVSILDTAVSGSTPALERGEVIALVGGDKEIYEQYKGLLDVFSKLSFYMGESGKGESMKLVVNTLLGIEMAALAEAIRLGEAIGLEKDQIIEVLSNTAVIPPGLKGKLDNIKQEQFPTQFKAALMHKDLDNIVEEAKEHNLTLPLTKTADKEFTETSKQYADQDFSAVFNIIK